MFDNYVIETESEAAGIVVRERNRFRFFAASHAYRALEGQLFGSPREAERAVFRHVKVARAKRRGPAPSRM